MSSYEKYKDAKIGWINEIPEHWNVKRFKYLFKFSRGLSITKENLQDEGVPCVNYGEIHSRLGIELNPKNDFLRCVSTDYLETSPNSLLKRGDFVFADTSEDIEGSGNFTFLNSDVPTFAGYHTIITKPSTEFSSKYLAYYFDSLDYRHQIRSIVNGTKVYSITQSILKNTIALLPSPEEQTAIANYLDEKTAQIDKLIANKQQLIELLKEERTAIINKAVSGEGKNWERKKLKYVAEVVLGKMLTPEDKGGFYLKPYLRSANLQWFNVDMSSIKEMWFSENELNRLRIKKNDLLVSEGGEVGRACIWNNEIEECYIQNSVHKITFYEGYNPFFFLYQFFILGSTGFFDSIVNRISIAHLTGEKIRDVDFYAPDVNEQNKIVLHIQKETKCVDSTVSKIEKEIELMREYKASLISEVVTGKLKVIDVPVIIAVPSKQIALAAEIMQQLYEEASFGRVKFQKVLYLCEHYAQLEGMQSNYIRAAAGPLDEELLSKMELQLRQLHWIDTHSSSSNRYKERISYSVMPKLNDYKKWYDKHWIDKNEAIQHIIGVLRFANTEKCEMMATLFAAWNDLIIKGNRTPTDKQIIKEVLSWHKSKQRLAEDKWQKELTFMKNQKIIPKGFGKLTIAA